MSRERVRSRRDHLATASNRRDSEYAHTCRQGEVATSCERQQQIRRGKGLARRQVSRLQSRTAEDERRGGELIRGRTAPLLFHIERTATTTHSCAPRHMKRGVGMVGE